jgi:hypothetical protein
VGYYLLVNKLDLRCVEAADGSISNVLMDLGALHPIEGYFESRFYDDLP